MTINNSGSVNPNATNPQSSQNVDSQLRNLEPGKLGEFIDNLHREGKSLKDVSLNALLHAFALDKNHSQTELLKGLSDKLKDLTERLTNVNTAIEQAKEAAGKGEDASLRLDRDLENNIRDTMQLVGEELNLESYDDKLPRNAEQALERLSNVSKSLTDIAKETQTKVSKEQSTLERDLTTFSNIFKTVVTKLNSIFQGM